MSTQRNFQNITEHELGSLASQVLTHYQHLTFKILDKSITRDQLTDEQLEALYMLRVEIKAAETELNNEMDRIIETLSLVQSVRFLATATHLQVEIRILGWQTEAARR
ncbi:hypothetical protein MKX01_016505 [Papaver californicum]|nr:hypothetical protein MKX01_016505 [Papaver californicum]